MRPPAATPRQTSKPGTATSAPRSYGGTTSVDVTTHGIDKAYGINKLRSILGIGIEEMIFVGDALFPGGNDYPAKQSGVVSIQVRDPDESKRVIETILACLGAPYRG